MSYAARASKPSLHTSCIVEMIVVNEGAIKHDSTMRLQGFGQHVGSVGGTSAVTVWTGLSFGISLHGDAGEVRDVLINLVELGIPPGRHLRIERIECAEAADFLRAGDIDAHGGTARRPRA